MGAARCTAAGCGRFVRGGDAHCARHGGAGPPAAASDERAHGEERQRELAEEFRRRLERGAYRELFGQQLDDILRQAALQRDLSDEIGALRFVLARLLVEERDLARLAANVARVAGVTIQAARAQRSISDETADSLSAVVTTILAEMDD